MNSKKRPLLVKTLNDDDLQRAPPTIPLSLSFYDLKIDDFSDEYDHNNNNSIYSISLLSPPLKTLHSILNISSPEEPLSNIPRVSISLQNISQNSIPSNSGQSNEGSYLLRDEIFGFEEMVVFAPMAKKYSNIYFNLELGKLDANRDENQYSEFYHHLDDFSSFIHNYQHINYLNLSHCRISDDNVSILLCLKDCRLVRKLNLSHNELGCSSLKYLSEKLLTKEVMNGNLEELLLSHNLIGNLGLVSLSKWISHNTTLRTLSLNENNFDFLGFKALCYGMILNNTITTLDVSNNNLKLLQLCKQLQNISFKNTFIYDPSFELDLKRSNVIYLDVEGNNLGDYIVMKMLSSMNYSIHSLILKGNKITDKSTDCLIKLLKLNSEMSLLDVRDNLLSVSSSEILKQAKTQLSSNTTLLLDAITLEKQTLPQKDCVDGNTTETPSHGPTLACNVKEDTVLTTTNTSLMDNSQLPLNPPPHDQTSEPPAVCSQVRPSTEEESDIVNAFLKDFEPQPQKQPRNEQHMKDHQQKTSLSPQPVENDEPIDVLSKDRRGVSQVVMNLSNFQTPHTEEPSMTRFSKNHHVDLSQYSISKLRGQYVSSPLTLSPSSSLNNHSTLADLMKNLSPLKTRVARPERTQENIPNIN
nr:unnamed protein product [Naegleria fowleri]